MSIELYSPEEIGERLAARMTRLRLAQDLRRETLAERAGVSPATVKRFEVTGQVTLANLLRLASALGCLEQFEGLFAAAPAASIAELEQRVLARGRRRGRR